MIDNHDKQCPFEQQNLFEQTFCRNDEIERMVQSDAWRQIAFIDKSRPNGRCRAIAQSSDLVLYFINDPRVNLRLTLDLNDVSRRPGPKKQINLNASLASDPSASIWRG